MARRRMPYRVSPFMVNGEYTNGPSASPSRASLIYRYQSVTANLMAIPPVKAALFAPGSHNEPFAFPLARARLG